MEELTPNAVKKLISVERFLDARCFANPCHRKGSLEVDEAPFVVFFESEELLNSPWGYCFTEETAHACVQAFREGKSHSLS